MQKERQLTSRLPWIETFYPSVSHKFKELNSSLGLPPSEKTDTVCLTREAVEDIAFSANTPGEIAINFAVVLETADQLIRGGIASHRILYVLHEDGLTLSLTSKDAIMWIA